MQGFTEENTSRSVQTKSGKIHYHEAGEGYPLIMIHGSGPGATGWTNFGGNIPALAEKYRVIALDLPGWGASPPLDPDGTLFKVCVDAVSQLMDALDIKTAALMGNSLGGAVCLEFTVRAPERMSHMITMGAGLQGFPLIYTPGGGMTEGLRIVWETYAAPTPANFRRMVSIFAFDPAFVTDELCEMRSQRSLSRPEHLKNFLAMTKRGMAGFTDLRPTEVTSTLATLKTPCLFIHGRDDRVVPMENSLNLVSWAPNSQAHIFNQCGHWAQIEHAAAFNKLVDGFLQANGVS